MAHLVNAVVIHCPLCSSEAIVRVWSCGCQELTAAPHRSFLIPPDLRRRIPFPTSENSCDSEYFRSFERSCGMTGEPASHGTHKSSAVLRKPFE